MLQFGHLELYQRLACLANSQSYQFQLAFWMRALCAVISPDMLDTYSYFSPGSFPSLV